MNVYVCELLQTKQTTTWALDQMSSLLSSFNALCKSLYTIVLYNEHYFDRFAQQI